MNNKIEQESRVWKFTVDIEAGTLTASYDPQHAIDSLQRLFRDLHTFPPERVIKYAAQTGLTHREAEGELIKQRDKDVQICLEHALKIMRDQMGTAIRDTLKTFVIDEIPLQVLRDLNGQTSMGQMRVGRFKGGSRTTRATEDGFGGDGSIAATMEGVAQRYYDLAKERMGAIGRGRPSGSREDYDGESQFLTDLRDAIKKLLSRERRLTKFKVANELVISVKTLNRRLNALQIDFKAEVERQKADI